MKILDPSAVLRYKALKESAQHLAVAPFIKIVPFDPCEERETAGIGLEFPNNCAMISPVVRNAVSFLFAQCDTVQINRTDAGVSFVFTIFNVWKEEP